MSHRRLPSDSGIAIGAILFVIALMAILASVIAAGSGDFGNASITDRVAADMASQANLIRSKINECNLVYGTNANYDGYPDSGGAPVVVSGLSCTGDPTGMQSLWSGQRPALLPPPTKGFDNWYYLNTNTGGLGGTAAGGRCIYTQPNIANANSNRGLVDGLSKAASKFANATDCSSGCPREVVYDPNSTSQKFVVWITVPSGTPDSRCLP